MGTFLPHLSEILPSSPGTITYPEVPLKPIIINNLGQPVLFSSNLHSGYARESEGVKSSYIPICPLNSPNTSKTTPVARRPYNQTTLT